MLGAMEGDLRLELPATGFGRRVLTYLTVPVAAVAAVLGGPAGLMLGASVGVGYAAAFWRLGRVRLIVDDEGIERRGMFSSKRLAWRDIQSYSFSSINPTGEVGVLAALNIGMVGALMVAAASSLSKKVAHSRLESGRLLLRGAGIELEIGPNFREVALALERVFGELHQRLASGTHFGPLTFDGSTLTHVKKGALALMEIEKVTVSSGGTLSVRKVGKRLAWVSLPMARVDNLLLLLEQLSQHGVTVEIDGACYLPGPTLRLIDRMAAAQRALPAARVHRP